MPCEVTREEELWYEAEAQKKSHIDQLKNHIEYVQRAADQGLFWDNNEKFNLLRQSKYIRCDDINELTALLCSMCKDIEKEGLDGEYIYDGRNPKARKLADWWDKHKEFDKKRVGRTRVLKDLLKETWVKIDSGYVMVPIGVWKQIKELVFEDED